MAIAGVLALGVAMAIGVVGIVIPLVPGSLLILGAGLVWVWVQGGTGAWVVLAVMALVLAAGVASKYVLPARSVKGSPTPRTTLFVGAVGAIIGFFVIPVVGLVVGGLLGVYGAELRSHGGDAGAAWRATLTTVRAVGLGIAIELAAGIAAVAIWAVAAFTLR